MAESDYRTETDEYGEKDVKDAIHYVLFGKKAHGYAENEYVREYLRRLEKVEGYVRTSVAENRFNDMSLCYFGQITRNRCRMECADIREHSMIYYFPIAFELSKGCSVGCDFCGFAADKLSGIFRYNEENAVLWKEILNITKRIIGQVAGSCPCYFATEPFDNPDYEKFLLVYNDVFGEIPQTTTAVCERDPDRFRRFLDLIGRKNLREHASVRISIRSLAQFQKIREEFSEDELADIELLANHRESVNRYSDSGRSRNNCDLDDKKRSRYSISCVSGLYVNMVEKTISFIEPEIPDDEFSLGYREREKKSFKNAEEYEKYAKIMINSYARFRLGNDERLMWNKNIRIDNSDEKIISFDGEGSHYRISKGKLMLDLIACVNEEKTFSEMVSKLGLFGNVYETAMQRLQDLYIRGYIRII